ncbi:hypothetical protein N7465_000498 [Penicillium sp. CMV-2018d]|nr:hypothetical protein N7465_000498 [Penicillium sp. CMV-2018d]
MRAPSIIVVGGQRGRQPFSPLLRTGTEPTLLLRERTRHLVRSRSSPISHRLSTRSRTAQNHAVMSTSSHRGTSHLGASIGMVTETSTNLTSALPGQGVPAHPEGGLQAAMVHGAQPPQSTPSALTAG